MWQTCSIVDECALWPNLKVERKRFNSNFMHDRCIHDGRELVPRVNGKANGEAPPSYPSTVVSWIRQDGTWPKSFVEVSRQKRLCQAPVRTVHSGKECRELNVKTNFLQDHKTALQLETGAL